LLTSKEILEKTGISRATLNNYIASGVVPKPEVLPPGPAHGDAPRIGYFPDDVLARIADIQRLKSEGWSMQRITERFGGTPAGEAQRAASAPAPTPMPSAAPVPQVAPPAALASTAPRSESAAPAFIATTGTGPNAASPADRPAAPRLTPVAVLSAQLDHPRRVWTELPPEEYFELVNEVWVAADPIVRRHHGQHGKHPGDGMLCYFLPQGAGNYLWNALSAALEIREAMRRISKEWQLRKRWAAELNLNTGVDEGDEWLGGLRPGARPEFTVLARTLRHAGRISDLARSGAVWASKNLVAKLSTGERRRLRYGVRRRDASGEELFVPSVFTREAGETVPGALRDFKESGLPPLTEIFEMPQDGPAR
jgi:class 3 adenylate cyclase